MQSNKCAVGFGSSQKRFGKVTMHPKLNASPVTGDICADPCYYYPKDIKDIYPLKTKEKREPWKNKVELEEWSKNLGFRNQKILSDRKWYNSLLGPAFYSIKESPTLETACNNLGFGRTARFKSTTVSGPQSYYKEVPFKAPNGPHSERPSFERGDPCRFKQSHLKWSLSPNRYKIIDKEDISEKPKKLVSLRGPYDIFTGKRDGTSIKNHFNTKRTASETWPYEYKSSFETYKKSKFGTMNKSGRSIPYRGRLTLTDLALCIKDLTAPGPTTYDLEKDKMFEKNKYGFNSSYDRPPCYQRVIVWPGVGRYDLSDVRSIPGHGHEHVFLSKVERTIGANIPPAMYSF